MARANSAATSAAAARLRRSSDQSGVSSSAAAASSIAAGRATALLAFWAYYAGHELGETYSYFLLFDSMLLIAASLYGGRIDRELLLRLMAPLALWILGSAFLVFLGFMHGGTSAAVGMSATRFSAQLPSDNDIPHFFAEWFFTHGHQSPQRRGDAGKAGQGKVHRQDREQISAGHRR